MTKAVLFDADGVVITLHPYFSKRLQDEFGVSIEKIMPFFRSEFELCKIGKADLKEELAKYLPEWGWKKSLDELLNAWFSGEKATNSEILEMTANLRIKGVKCYLASENEKYRAAYMMKEMGLEKYFDGVFFSCDLGYTKSDPEFYQTVISKLGLES